MLRRSGWVLSGARVSAGGGSAYYEIRVAGVLDGERWATWFNGLQVSGQGGEKPICGLVADQPALQGQAIDHPDTPASQKLTVRQGLTSTPGRKT